MFDPAPVGIALADQDGRLVETNRALEELLGYAASELAGTRYPELIHPADWLRGGGPPESHRSLRLEARCRRRDGTFVWTRVHAAPVGGQGASGYSVVTVEDIHEHKRLEERLAQSQRLEAMGRLAGGIAHDFNNLLTAIEAYSDFLLERGVLDEPARRDVGEIKRAAGRAAELTRQLLAFGRRQVLQPQVLSLNDVVRQTEAMLRRVLGEDVELAAELEPELWSARFDPGQLEQVIVNLALNARDAMPDGGRLTLSTGNVEGDRPQVTVSVADTGVGMDEGTLERIFEPFFTTKEEGKGTGLGLATVYGIVEQSGGTIEVASEPGRGATFTILLPRAEAESRVAMDPAAA